MAIPEDIQWPDITTNTNIDIPLEQPSIGTGWSMSLSGQSSGNATVRKRLPDGTYINFTDPDGVPLIISVFPTTVNVLCGSGSIINVLTSGIAGTLKVTCNPIKSTH